MLIPRRENFTNVKGSKFSLVLDALDSQNHSLAAFSERDIPETSSITLSERQAAVYIAAPGRLRA